MTRPTVVLALHDGFYGCGTGAGHSNHALLTTLTDLISTDVRLVVLPVYLNSTSTEYDPGWYCETAKMLARINAATYPVDNGTGGQVRFGGMGCFRRVVRHAAGVITCRVLPDAGPVLILALDVPFFGLASLLPTDIVPNLVLIPRSTARIHAFEDRERISWESRALRIASERGGRIAAISSFMRAHLRNDYMVPDHVLIDLPNGLSPADWKLTPPDHELFPARVRKGFLFAMGCAQPCKGFDDFLDAVALLNRQGIVAPHVVLAAVTDHPELSGYQQHLAHRITS